MFECALCLAKAVGSKYNKHELTESWVMLCKAHKDFKPGKAEIKPRTDLERAIIYMFMEGDEKKRLGVK